MSKRQRISSAQQSQINNRQSSIDPGGSKREHTAQKPVKVSISKAMDSGSDLEPFNVCPQVTGKGVAQPSLLNLIKPEPLSQILEVFWCDLDPGHRSPMESLTESQSRRLVWSAAASARIRTCLFTSCRGALRVAQGSTIRRPLNPRWRGAGPRRHRASPVREAPRHRAAANPTADPWPPSVPRRTWRKSSRASMAEQRWGVGRRCGSWWGSTFNATEKSAPAAGAEHEGGEEAEGSGGRLRDDDGVVGQSHRPVHGKQATIN